MSDQKTAIDLSAFATEYEIVGEQDSPDESRIFVANRKTDDARRRDDRTGVLITVHSTPAGDEANALTQYAADVGTLKGLTHRRLVPVLDSKWIGEDQLAVVTQRIADPTLAQKLLTQEEFHSTRIAAILREVNGLLEWAREQKIVHRRVTPEQVYLEPKTDRVRVTFAIAPISRLKQPGPHDDARTIARLAVAMLGGDPDIQVCDQDMLLSLRPNLPQLFCQATAKLLDPKDTATPDDVAAFLGLISMADPLVEGETERDRIRAEILEEQRVEREKLAAERAAFDAKVAEERAAFDAQMADERAAMEKQMADERAAFEKAREEERARVENERLELQKAVTRERAELQKALEAERAALLARREELEKTVADQRAELERAAAKDRAEIERLRAELRAAGDQEIEKKRLMALEDITGEEESVLDHEDLAAPMFGMPVLPPIEPITFDDETPLLSEEKIVFPPTAELESTVEAERVEREARPGFWSSRRNQLIAAGVAAIVAIGGVSAVVIGNRGGSVPVAARGAVRPAASAPAPGAPGAAPTLATTPAPAPAAPMAFTVDSATARAWLDSLRRADPVDVPWAIDMARVRVERA
ncbi:MAG: hypothetical protein JWN79_530, partial [Gemmatimonadetes bacterium]|nr:hypothetical protein [Gemmatimonadota bacterium]